MIKNQNKVYDKNGLKIEHTLILSTQINQMEIKCTLFESETVHTHSKLAENEANFKI